MRPAPPSIYDSLKSLLDELELPFPARRTGPGRPAKNRSQTTPLALHLYKSHIQWLDQYADMLQASHPDTLRLSRVEIIRGLLLGLGQFALEHNLSLPNRPIASERDLQHALAEALSGAAPSARAQAATLSTHQGETP